MTNDNDSRTTGVTSASSPTLPSPALYTIQGIPGKGLGLLAARDLAAGTLLLSEAPLLSTACVRSPASTEADLAKALRQLPKPRQRAFFALHNNFPGRRDPLSNIVRSNAYPLGLDGGVGAVFETISRINHSCRPNAQHAWDALLQRETVHAVRDVPAGAEITLSYHAFGPYEERQAALKSCFGFECRCELCELPERERRASDERLRRAKVLDDAIGDPKRVAQEPGKALADCRELERIYEDEGIADQRLTRLYWDAFQICAKHGDEARAKRFVERFRQRKILGEGMHCKDVLEATGYAKNPRAWKGFGDTKRWATELKDMPQGVDVDLDDWLWQRAG